MPQAVRRRLKQERACNCKVRCGIKVNKVYYFSFYYLKVGMICKLSSESEIGWTGELGWSDRQPGSKRLHLICRCLMYSSYFVLRGSTIIVDVLTPPFGLLVHFLHAECKVCINVFSSLAILPLSGALSADSNNWFIQIIPFKVS